MLIVNRQLKNIEKGLLTVVLPNKSTPMGIHLQTMYNIFIYITINSSQN